MAFRLTVLETRDLTTVRIAGRLRDDAVTLLHDACGRTGRPLVLDLSQVTGASDAAVLLLRRLAGEGVHLLGASHYVALLLAAETSPAIVRARRRRLRPQHQSQATRRRGKANLS